MAGFQSYKRCKGYKFISASKGSQSLGKQRFQIITKENTCGPQEYGGSFFFTLRTIPIVEAGAGEGVGARTGYPPFLLLMG